MRETAAIGANAIRKDSEIEVALKKMDRVLSSLETVVPRLKEELEPVLSRAPSAVAERDKAATASNSPLAEQIHSFADRADWITTLLESISERICL